MVHCMARIPSEAASRQIKAELSQCIKVLGIRKHYALSGAIDVYEYLCNNDIAFLAGHDLGADGVDADHPFNYVEDRDEDSEVGMEFARLTMPQNWTIHE